MNDDKIKRANFGVEGAFEKLNSISNKSNILAIDVAMIIGIITIGMYGEHQISYIMNDPTVQKEYDEALKYYGINERNAKTLCEAILEQCRTEINNV